MYTPKPYEVKDSKLLLSFIRANPFAILIGVKERTPIATHIPFVVIEDGDSLRLLAHVSRANEQWKWLEENNLVIFAGPHAYVSPKHYEKEENVPTWNYAAVHAYGPAQILDSMEDRRKAVEELIRATEADYFSQWNALQSTYQNNMLKAIVAFEIKVNRLEGKFKLSQNKTRSEQTRISEEFMKNPDSQIRATGNMMKKVLNEETL